MVNSLISLTVFQWNQRNYVNPDIDHGHIQMNWTDASELELPHSL